MDARPDLNHPLLGRRTLLGGLLGAATLSACGTTSERTITLPPATKSVTQITYADQHPDQYGDFGLPTSTPKALAILVHGGFWLDQYGASLMNPMAADLRTRGYATWNIEYRRIGDGGGFPATFLDVAAAYDKVAELSLPPGLPTVAIGHSAGGHLAVWAASRTARTPGGKAKVTAGTGHVATTLSLSGVLDLVGAAGAGLGNGAVQELMAARPIDRPSTYARADPTQLVPAHGQVFAVHAKDDQIVPRNQSADYVRADRAAGGKAEFVSVPGGHFDLIDPTSAAWKKILTLLPAGITD